jgi:protein-L-isoaspartate(D-aspartate) O-methyltransferase
MIKRAPTQEDLVREMEREGIRDGRLLEAFRAVPRSLFVPEDLVDRAYRDEPLPIEHGQVTTQPSLLGKMVESLSLAGDEHVLEIGTGYGFQTALLARLAMRVWSVERYADLATRARANLARSGARNVTVAVGDGSAGLPERAPFDAIVVSAAFPSVPPPLVEQLPQGGRLVQPIGSGGSEAVILFERRGGALVPSTTVTTARFVKLVGEHGFAPDVCHGGGKSRVREEKTGGRR